MPADSIPVDTSASKESNSSVAANAPMRAPPMTMLKKAMVMATKKILNSSSGWGMEGSVLEEVAAPLAGERWDFALVESDFGPGWGCA